MGEGGLDPPAAHPSWGGGGPALFSFPYVPRGLQSALGPQEGVMENWEKLGRVRTPVGEIKCDGGECMEDESTAQINTSRKTAELALDLSPCFHTSGVLFCSRGPVWRECFAGGRRVPLSGP